MRVSVSTANCATPKRRSNAYLFLGGIKLHRALDIVAQLFENFPIGFEVIGLAVRIQSRLIIIDFVKYKFVVIVA